MKAAFLAMIVAMTTQVAENNAGREWTFVGYLKPELPSTCATVLGGCLPDGTHFYTIPHLSWQICRQYVEKAKFAGGDGGACI